MTTGSDIKDPVSASLQRENEIMGGSWGDLARIMGRSWEDYGKILGG